ncbi:hypothetical protein FRC11_004506 [Ceratobasidium sp. 423]|nr:hypothetical protein FRC11_004506 [Ceratobasidium sp. 423]
MRPTSTPPPIPNSPRPQYAERPDIAMQSYLENPPIYLSLSSLPPPPPYLRHTFELELEICIPSAYGDESEEIVARLLESLSKSLPESSLIHGFRFKPVKRQLSIAEASSTEGRRSVMSKSSTLVSAGELDDLARLILEDIRNILDTTGFPFGILKH